MPIGARADVPPKSGDPAFDRTVELVESNFYNPSALGRFGDVVREAVASLPPSADARARAAASGPAIDHILASLGATHTGRYTPDQLDYYELADIFRFNYRDRLRELFPPDGEITYPGVGIATEVIDGKRFVRDVYDGAPADKAGVKAGDEILSVDGQPFAEIKSFAGKVGKTARLELRRDPAAAPISVDVPVEKLQPSDTFVSGIENSARIVERNGKRIGYLRIWFFVGGDVQEAIDRALTGPLKDADALVVDLRSRWGGAPPDAAEVFLGGTPPFRFIDRNGKAEDSNVRWHKPVVGIIDEGTRSGLEVFAYALKLKGIPLVGARTAGALLGGRGYMLPDGSLLELAVADVEVNGVRLEGKGVEPDVAVPFDIRYAAGRDPQLDAALETILPKVL
jgi:carboxyl-terminal processing protease